MSAEKCPWPLEELLPHAKQAIVLQSVRAWSKKGVTATVHIDSHTPFCEAAGVPVHIGLEYMAQACGVWSGCMARSQDVDIKPGYLLGTRNFEAKTDFLPLGADIEVIAEIEYFDGKMGVFSCRLVCGGEILATARLNAYQPLEGLVLDD